jgi:hypothetical protein
MSLNTKILSIMTPQHMGTYTKTLGTMRLTTMKLSTKKISLMAISTMTYKNDI